MEQKFVHKFYISYIIINWMVYFCFEVIFNVYFRKYDNKSAWNTLHSYFLEYIQEKGVCLFPNSNKVCYVQ